MQELKVKDHHTKTIAAAAAHRNFRKLRFIPQNSGINTMVLPKQGRSGGLVD